MAARLFVSGAAAVIALIARFALDPLLGDSMPVMTFFPAVVISAWHGGFVFGLLGTAVGGLLADYFFFAHRGTIFQHYTTAELTALALYAAVGLFLSWLASGYRQVSLAHAQSEARYRQLVDTAHEGIWLIDPAGSTLFVNPRLAEMAGTTASRMIGRPAWDFVFPADRPAALRSLGRQDAPARAESAEFRLQRADGQPVWVRTTSSPVPDASGAAVALLGMVTDVSEERRAAESLRQSEERYRLLTEMVPQFVWTAQECGGPLDYANEYWTLYTGLPLADVQANRWLPLVHPADLPHVAAQMSRAQQTGSGYEAEYRLRRASGEYRWHLARARRCRLPDGTDKWLGTAVDIHDRKLAEEQVLCTNQELERANRELEQFAYAASHDLQEPLRTVGASTELLLRRHVPAGDERAQQLAAFIQTGVRRMESLVRDLLAYSRVVHEDATPTGSASLSSALDLSLQLLADQVRAAGAVVECGPLPQIVGEETQLGQVFQNLLSNALKYRRKEVPVHIRISATQENGHCVITVSDNGIGFDPKHAERIFGLFKRLHRDEYPGTGVGLGICRRIVERHGGRIWAESAGEGRGARFHFTLPVSAPAAVSTPAAVPTAALSHSEAAAR